MKNKTIIREKSDKHIIRYLPWPCKKAISVTLTRLVLLLALLAFLFVLIPPLAQAAWYNSNWEYRKPIKISGSTSGQTDYHVKVTVSFVTGKMNSDFSYIRFTSSDGTTLIDHWRESYTASSTADFWVEVPSIPTSGTTI